MADYKVPATVDINAPFINDLSADDIYWVAYADVDGTQADPNPIWSADVMYTHFYKSGQNVLIDYRKYDMTTHNTSALTYPYTAIFAYKTTLDDSGSLAIGFQSGFDKPNIISQIKNGNGTFLFYGTIASADSAGIIEDKNKWEDPKNTDPNYNPNKPVGGENADISPITSDDCLVTQLPDDPMMNDNDDPNHTQPNFFSGYVLTGSQVKQLGKVFWYNGNDSFIHKLMQLFENGCTDPMASIGGFIRLPINMSYISKNSRNSWVVSLGGIMVRYQVEGGGWETATSSGIVTNRWVEMTYSKDIGLSFGTYYDYIKTKISLYLPYVGQVQLSTEEVMGGTLFVRYIVDVFTGDLLCTVQVYKTVNNHNKRLNSIIGRYKGNCAMPITYSRGNTEGNTQNIFNGLIGGLGSIAGGNILGGISSVANAAFSQRIQTQSGGSLSSSGLSGWLDVQYPYLIIERNIPMYPENWRATVGAEQYATFTVSSLTGFTKFHEIHCEIPRASDNEKSQIESILKSGVIL